MKLLGKAVALILGLIVAVAMIAVKLLLVPLILMVALGALGYSFNLLACFCFWAMFCVIVNKFKRKVVSRGEAWAGVKESFSELKDSFNKI